MVATVPRENCDMHELKQYNESKCECIFSCVFLFENISLSWPADVVSQYFQEDIMKLYHCDKKKVKRHAAIFRKCRLHVQL